MRTLGIKLGPLEIVTPPARPPGWQIAPDKALLVIQSLPSLNGSLPCCRQLVQNRGIRCALVNSEIHVGRRFHFSRFTRTPDDFFLSSSLKKTTGPTT
jgi:hypothetical protein